MRDNSRSNGMQDFQQDSDLRFLIESFFSDPERRTTLQKGDVLMHQNEVNERLYLILEGTVSAHVQEPDGTQFELFRASRHSFVGVYSFFAETYRSLLTIVAEEACELAYIGPHLLDRPHVEGVCLFEKFMPIIVTELAQRHQHMRELTEEKETFDNWDGGYLTNDCQTVTDDDARAIARALERAVSKGEASWPPVLIEFFSAGSFVIM